MGFLVLGLFRLLSRGCRARCINVESGVRLARFCSWNIYERRHTRMISDFGRAGSTDALVLCLFVMRALSSIGLPFMNGFVGEFLILLGTWTSSVVWHSWMVTMLAGTGVIWARRLYAWICKRCLERRRRGEAKLPD